MNQAVLEYERSQAALHRYRSNQAKYVSRGTETRQTPARVLLRQSLNDYAFALKSWMADAARGAVPGGKAYPILALVDPDRSAFLSARVVFNQISRSNTFTRIASEMGSAIEREIRFAHCKATQKGMWNFANRDMGWGVSEERISRYLVKQARKEGNQLEEVYICARDRQYVGAVLLEIFLQVHSGEGGIVFEDQVEFARGRQKSLISPSKETLEWLEQAHATHEVLTPIHESCVIPPKPWTSMDSGGYHTDHILQRNFIAAQRGYSAQNYGPRTANDGNDLSEVFACANALQGTALSVNEPLLETLLHFWEIGSPIGDLPRREELQLPSISQEARATKEGRMDWRRRFHRARDENLRSRGRRFDLVQTMAVAQRDMKKQRWFLPVSADFRLRMYTAHTGMTYQGGDIQKALVRTADGYPIKTDEDAYWLAVHGANCWGLDKEPFDERVQWVHEHKQEIQDCHEDPISAAAFWSSAEEPWQFLSWCLDWGGYLTAGSGHESTTLCGNDASCSGMQIFSLLLGDEDGGRATNVVPGDTRNSLYRVVADDLTRVLTEEASQGHEWAGIFLTFFEGLVPTEVVKRPVMTIPYGLQQHSGLEYVAQAYRDHIKKRGLEDPPFPGEGYKPCLWLTDKLWASVRRTIPSAFGVMEWLQGAVDQVVALGAEPYWSAPTGGIIYQGYYRSRTKTIKTTFGDSVRKCSLKEEERELGLNRAKMRNAVAPNFVHGIDAAIVHKSVNTLYAQGLRDIATIHDDWRVPAPWVPRMRDAVRGAVAEIFQEDLLMAFKKDMERLGATVDDPPARGSMDPSVVLESPYYIS